MSDNKIDVQFDLQVDGIGSNLSAIEQLVRDVCRDMGVDNASVSISIVDDEKITELHKKYLNKSTATDVMSFDLTDDFDSAKSFALAVNVQMAARQAQKRGHSPEAELALYITHGLLHNLGFDDCDKDDAIKMHEMEDMILKRHGFGRTYFKDE